MFKKTTVNVLLTILLLIIAGCAGSGPGQNYDGFAKCITSKGATMYGTYWCAACAAQKKEFGDSFRYINYIECDPRGKNSQSELCLKKGIASYPTWEFSDKSKKTGAKSLKDLAETTNCELKQ